MRTLSDLQQTAVPRFSQEVLEVRGDECLISDNRCRVRPTEVIERKLQYALQYSRPLTHAETASDQH